MSSTLVRPAVATSPRLHTDTTASKPADNGFAIGSHRRQPGKTLGYEEDIHVPLIVRGPDVPSGIRDTLSSWSIVDLSKTIMKLAGAEADYVDDGREIDLHRDRNPLAQPATVDILEAHGNGKNARHAISEFWVLGVEEGVFAGESFFGVSCKATNTFSIGQPRVNNSKYFPFPLSSLRAYNPLQLTAPSGCTTRTKPIPPLGATLTLFGVQGKGNSTTSSKTLIRYTIYLPHSTRSDGLHLSMPSLQPTNPSSTSQRSIC